MMIRRRTLGILTALFTLSGTVALAADIVVESRTSGKNHANYTEVSGHWLDSNTPMTTAKSQADDVTPNIGSRKVTIPLTSDSGAVVRFSPGLKAPGHYYVYVTFPGAANVTPVHYRIHSAKGDVTKTMAQDGWGTTGNQNGNKWILLGDYDFGPGNEQYVELQIGKDAGAASSHTAGQAFADAVLFSTEPHVDSIAISGNVPAPKVFKPAPKAAATRAIAPDNSPINWTEDLAAARLRATSNGHQIFVFFYSPGNQRSADYEQRVLNDPSVKGVINSKFEPVKINMEANRELTNQLQVFRAGTINIYSAAGDGIMEISDTPDAKELVQKLTQQ